MNDILDEKDLPEDENAAKLSKHRPRKTAIYVSIMLIAGFFLQNLVYWPGSPFAIKLKESIKYLVFCLAISFVIEGFRFLYRRYKEKRSGIKKARDPFWFQTIEGAFGIWILFTILYVAFYFLNFN